MQKLLPPSCLGPTVSGAFPPTHHGGRRSYPEADCTSQRPGGAFKTPGVSFPHPSCSVSPEHVCEAHVDVKGCVLEA